MVKTTESPVFKTPLLWAAFLLPCILFTSFLSFEFSPLLFTVPFLISSTIFILRVIKKKKKRVDLSDIPDSQNLLEDEVAEKVEPLIPETVPEYQASKGDDKGNNINEHHVESTQIPTDSESSDDSETSRNLELNWMLDQNQEISNDDSVSVDDEDGLIEIAIPGTDSIDDLSEEPKQNPPSFLPESIFRQQDLDELLVEMNEVNEEENLIEIDISMGSIKCSRFEIKA
ncbi:hypothetical protein SLE2022_399050 [Rubroshorea leprosula]